MRCILVLFACLLSWSAMAEDNRCAPIDQIEARLAAEYQETRIAQGMAQGGRAMLVIFAAPNGKTWTAVMLRPDGIGCMATAGADWQAKHDPAPVEGKGS